MVVEMFSEVNTSWLEDFSIATVGRLQMEECSVLQSPLNGVGGRYWVAAMGWLVVGGCRVVLAIVVTGVVGGCGGGGGGGGPPGGGRGGPPAGGGGGGAPPPPQVAGGGGGRGGP